MAEYTYEDIIMDPEDPRLEGAIGKECYFSDYPKNLLLMARKKLSGNPFCLKEIFKAGPSPFIDENGHGWCLIIVKKEEPKPKYVPFESKWEFIESYMDNRSNHEYLDHQISCLGGIWLKDKDREGAYFMVTEIWKEGVVVSDIKMKTTKEGNDEYYTTNETTEWKELLRDYTFLDGSPCGKEVEE